MVNLIDTHCHLDLDRFDGDREDVIKRAKDAGLVRILNPGIDIESSQSALNLSELYDIVYAAIGIHPNSSLMWGGASRKELYSMATHPKVVAIGEIGLDYYRDRAPMDIQKKVFKEQLSLAGELHLPIIVHCRQAGEDILEILREWFDELIKDNLPLKSNPGVLHSFSEDLDFAYQALKLNFRIGITGPVTFDSGDRLRQIVQIIPLNCQLIETDSPFLTPHPHRGKRNEPSNVKYVAEKIAEIRSSTVEAISVATTENADTLFHW